MVVGADGGRTPTTAEVTDGEIVLEGWGETNGGNDDANVGVEFVGPAADA